MLETLLWLGAFKQNQDAKNEDVEKYEAERKKWALKICKYCVNNFADFAFDSYASHILKTGFQVRSYSNLIDLDFITILLILFIVSVRIKVISQYGQKQEIAITRTAKSRLDFSVNQ